MSTKPHMGARAAELIARVEGARTPEEREQAMAAVDARLQELEAVIETARALKKEASRCLN